MVTRKKAEAQLLELRVEKRWAITVEKHEDKYIASSEYTAVTVTGDTEETAHEGLRCILLERLRTAIRNHEEFEVPWSDDVKLTFCPRKPNNSRTA